MAGKADYYYQCSDCGKDYASEPFRYLCPECGQQNHPGQPMKGVLKVVYDYQTIRKKSFEQLFSSDFLDILPLKSLDSWPKLKVGRTPLYAHPQEKYDTILYLKDDSQNPTFSFKDRASALVSAYAAENGIETIAAASTGNAGSSLAGICAANRQKSIIYVPASAPVAKLVQIVTYGAQIIKVDGNYDAAFELSLRESERTGIFNRNTAYNPLTIEGKKTASLEIFHDLGELAPDYIFVSAGDGVILSGIYKGFEDLMHLGLTDKMPVLIAVQAEGSPNLVKNLFSDTFAVTPSTTLADSISVDVPRNFLMARQFIMKYKGNGLLVSDQQIISAIHQLASEFGLFAEPASAAAYAGYLKFLEMSGFPGGSKIVIQLTGSGLKDVNALQRKTLF